MSSQGKAAGLYFDVSGAGGYNVTSVPDGSKAPTLMQYSAGMTLGYLLTSNFFLGITSDMRLMNQYSKPTAEVENRRGQRLNVASPTIGLVTKFLLLKADYQMLGDYILTSAKLADRVELKYTSPTGVRVSALLPLSTNLWMGIMVESMKYKESNVTLGVTSDGTLKSQQYGLAVTRTFGGM